MRSPSLEGTQMMIGPPHKVKLGQGLFVLKYLSDGVTGSPVEVVVGGVNSLAGGWLSDLAIQ